MSLLNSVHFSSARDNWETPQDFFEELNNEFRFILDVCAEKHSAKCKNYFTKKDDALDKEWNGTDTKWWHDYVMRASEIRFLKGRLKFDGHKNSAPFPSVIVVFKKTDTQVFKSMVR